MCAVQPSVFCSSLIGPGLDTFFTRSESLIVVTFPSPTENCIVSHSCFWMFPPPYVVYRCTFILPVMFFFLYVGGAMPDCISKVPLPESPFPDRTHFPKHLTTSVLPPCYETSVVVGFQPGGTCADNRSTDRR